MANSTKGADAPRQSVEESANISGGAPEPRPSCARPSEAQIKANRANAQLSTGPSSPETKAISSHNALKTGLTGRTVLLPTDDVNVYEQHVERFQKQFEPATGEEKTLVQNIADTEWRLARIPSLESGIFAIGRRELAEKFADEQDLAVRKAMIEAQIFMTYRKDLSNLALQERRLRSQRDADLACLKALQQERKKDTYHTKVSMKAAELYFKAKERGIEFDPTLFGFEFTNQEIQEYMDEQNALRYMVGSATHFNKAEFESYMTRRKATQEKKAA